MRSDWLTDLHLGKKGVHKPAFSWVGKIVATLQFAGTDLVEHRKIMQGKMPTKGNKHFSL